MPAFDDLYRILASQNLSVASSGGAANSTAAFSAQTYAVLVNFAGSVSSTGGIRLAVVSPQDAAANSTSALISSNWPMMFKVTPGQRISAISNDAGTPTLSVVELTK